MNNAKTHHFSMTFEPGDTWRKYSGITDFDTNDVVIVYVWSATYSGENYWVQLPHMYSTNSINIWPEFGEEVAGKCSENMNFPQQNSLYGGES